MSLSRAVWQRCLLCLVIQACAVLPAFAQEQQQPAPADTTTGLVFRWLNFALVFGGIVWAIRKFGAPYFRGTARAIGESIHGAAAGRAAAEHELSEATRLLASVDSEIQGLRRTAVRESATETERLRALAQTEGEKIARAAAAEIEASERIARQQLRAIAARAATERAAALARQRMNAAAERALFDDFVGELERSAR
jgi:F-type H+-transporting ATPase subunit b